MFDDIEKLYIWSFLIFLVNIFLLKISRIKRFRFIFPDKNWAVVTGGSSGIGRAFTEKLLTMGYSVMVFTRNTSKLDELQEKYGDRFKAVEVDFSNTNIYETVQENISNKKISLLINNIGQLGNPEYLINIKIEKLVNLINCNIVSYVAMSKLVISTMIKNNIKGTVLNISSITSTLPFPFLTTYSSTKAFIDRFSINLREECRNCDIKIININPHFVSTKISKLKPSLFVPSASKYVENIIEYGYFFPHVISDLFLYLSKLILPCVLYSILTSHLKSLIDNK